MSSTAGWCSAGWRAIGRSPASHLGSPASSYLTTIAIGPYRKVDDVGPHGLPLTYWVPREGPSYLRTFRKSPLLLEWLESKLGPYPFRRAGVVVVPSESAMETQTLVTFGTGRLWWPPDARGVLLHEYAHQWYGDTVTPRDWRDMWLNEGFAMYLQIRFDASHGGLVDEALGALSARRRPGAA